VQADGSLGDDEVIVPLCLRAAPAAIRYWTTPASRVHPEPAVPAPFPEPGGQDAPHVQAHPRTGRQPSPRSNHRPADLARRANSQNSHVWSNLQVDRTEQKLMQIECLFVSRGSVGVARGP
jgi:hypothetical protein